MSSIIILLLGLIISILLTYITYKNDKIRNKVIFIYNNEEKTFINDEEIIITIQDENISFIYENNKIVIYDNTKTLDHRKDNYNE